MEKKQTYILLAIAAFVAVGVSTMIVLGSQSKSADSTNSGSIEGISGLSEDLAPWPVETKGLAARNAILKIPLPGRETYHVHARLKIFVDGKETPVPDKIGVAPGSMLALHTHGTDGVIHLESDQPFSVTMRSLFAVWGVKMTDSQLGGYRTGDGKVLELYVNGQKVAQPADYQLKAKDSAVLGYGSPASFPTTFTEPFPKDL